MAWRIHQIYAIYSRSRKVLVVMAVLFTTEVASMLLLLRLALKSTGPVAATPEVSMELPGVVGPIHDFTGCYVISEQPYFFIWIPPLAFETVLCLFMLYKACTVYRDDWDNPLLSVLIRDRCV